MICYKKRLVEIGDKITSETSDLNEKIARVDEDIDEMVYKIYGVTDAEKKIIQNSLN